MTTTHKFPPQLAFIGFQMLNPQILNLLIEFVEERQEMWKGYLYVVILGISSFCIGTYVCMNTDAARIDPGSDTWRRIHMYSCLKS